MATISQSDSRRAYSWLWDSHICPKNSKWLQENLTDMDLKVKSMIKLIEEDADSFARRAEMYYKKRPELMKLVEEFYRAYRALAERYNHATGELHHAHRTIAKAFPDQDFPVELINDDLPSKLLPQDKDPKTSSTKEDDAIQLSNENQNLKGKCLQESERAGRAESEIQGLKKVLADVKAAKEDVLIQYHLCVEKLSNVEEELDNARKDSTRLNENAERAEIEVQVLKEALVQLETEKNAGLVKQRIYLEKISSLEAMLGQFQEDMKGLNERATWSESEAQNLQDEISRLQLEKEDMLRKYKQCLERILVLENLTSVTETNAKEFQMQAEKAENEVCQLKMSLADMKKEKEDLAIKYKCCLETISKLEKDLSSEREDLKRLNKDALIRNLKLKNAEDKCTLLENSNLSLRDEADQLAKKIAMKDQELSQKQEELENLQKNLLDKQSHHAHVEVTLQNLQSLHSQSQDDQKVLTLELQKALQMLNDLEVNKCVLEEEIKQARDENQSLNQKNLSSAASVNTMRNEMLSLRDVKDRLEKEVSYHTALSDSLQMEISSLKEEVESLNARYKTLLEQVEASGLSPRSFKSSVKELRDENEMLRQTCELGSCEKEFMSKKLQNMEDLLKKKVAAESSLADLNSELESSREKVKVLQELFHCVDGEKATLVAEKASLLSQLQAITENMHNLLGKNAVLENTLFAAKIELEGLREKSKGLEGICEMLKDERSHILAERGAFVLKLEDVERRLENMERKCSSLEAKYTDLHMEKEAMCCKAEELTISLNTERQERTNLGMMNETKLAGLEHQIRVLQEEDNWKRKEFEDELDRSLKSQFEISILQRFMKDMEEKNHSLVVECQKHVEASKLADKVISELESESHEQQVEAGILLDEIERLRFGIYDLFRAIETCADEKIKDEQTVVNHILAFIDNMKRSISNHEDDKQLLLVENSVLLTLLEQLEAKAMDVECQKVCLEREFEIMAEKLSLAKKEKDQLLGMNAKLKSDVNKSHQHNDLLEAELDGLRVKETELNKAYLELQEAYSQVNQENKELLRVFSDLKDEKYQVEQHDDMVLVECMTRGNESVFLQSFVEEKVKQLSLLLGDLNRQHEMNNGLRKETRALMEKLDLQRAENSLLNETVQKLEMETKGLKEYNAQMKEDILTGTETLLQMQGKLLVKQLKLEAAENVNSKLCRTVEELKSEVQDSLQTRHGLEKIMIQFSDANSAQRKEIEGLHMVNTNLKSKLGMLRQEINEKTVSKKALISELEKKKNEFELWEAEAVPFYFDLQFLSINEILIKDKVQELTEVSQTLKDENNSKTSEIVQLRGKIRSMESEISGLKCQLDAYGPVIAALKDDITFLEHNALLQKNIKAAHGQEQEFSEGATDPSRSSSEIFIEDQTLLSLQDLVIRIKAVSKLMEDSNTPISDRTTSNKSKQEIKSETEQLKLSRLVGRDKNEPSSRRRRGYKIELSDTPRLQKIKTKSPSEVRNRDLMKDIHQLSDGSLHRTSKNIQEDDKTHGLSDIRRDQTIGESLKMSYKMIEQCSAHDRVEDSNPNSKNPSTDSDMERELGVDSLELSTRSKKPNRETNRARIMERLTCDAEELEILQTTVETLRKKVEAHKKSRKAKNLDFDSVHDQLLESEETVVSLMDMNNRLMKSLEECSSPNENISPKSKDGLKTRRRRIAEQAHKVSQKIFRLQLEIQKIQCMLLEFEDEKGKRKLFKSKAIILRDLIYNGVTKRNKKRQLCGCIRPSTTQNGHS